MVYFVADATASWERAKRGLLDGQTVEALRELPFASNPEFLGLSVLERGAGYTIGHGVPVVPGNAPKRAWWSGRGHYALPDFAAIFGYQIVSKRFRALIEEFEPGVHQFMPVDVSNKKEGGELWGRWYWLNICNRMDSTDHEAMRKAGWYWKEIAASGERSPWDYDGWDQPAIKFSRQQTKDVTLWVDPFLSPKNFYAQNVFAKALRERGLHVGCSLTARDEV